jgi:transcriptional regulator with XRE-family HTH domain
MPHVTDGPTFGRQLQELRRQNGFTQEELAAALAQRSGPASSLIYDWHAWIAAVEQGRIPTVEHRMVVAVALTLHVPVSALLSPPVLDGIVLDLLHCK